jgi:hypothetical protein
MPVRSRLSEQAIAYFLFAALQQFYFDENKRTARCQINGYLMSHGFDAIRVIPLSFAQRRRCGNAVVRCASLWQRRRQVRPAASPPSLSSPASTTIPRSQITWRARRAIQAAGPSGRPDPPGQTVPDAALELLARSQTAGIVRNCHQDRLAPCHRARNSRCHLPGAPVSRCDLDSMSGHHPMRMSPGASAPRLRTRW